MAGGTEGYAPLRRGLLEHLPDMLDSEVKCYTALVLLAAPRTGIVRISLGDLADILGSTKPRVSARLDRLSEPHGENSTRYVSWTPGNRWHLTEIRVLNWKPLGSAADTRRDTQADTRRDTTSGREADETTTRTIFEVDLESQESQSLGEAAFRLAQLLTDLVHSRDPNARIRVMGTDRSILELLTTRSEAEIRRVIEWCQSDTFWRARIVSGNKLVEHFDALFAQASAVTPEPEDDDYWRNVVIAPPEPVAP